MNYRKLVLEEIVSRYEAEDSLYEFIKQAWPHIEGKIPFNDNWHIGAICEHLEALTKRQIRNLLINIPPRTSKTSLVSICWPAWVWIKNPTEKFLFASYAASLSTEHSVRCRRLIQSNWYQNRWGDRFKLVGDQNTKTKFENDQNGYRVSSSSGGAITGLGADVIVTDDANNVKDGESEVKREATNEWHDRVLSTRLNDPKTGIRVNVQQRLHEDDLTGHILNNDEEKDWVKLILPMEFEAARRSKTIILPSTKGKKWEDPRQQEGELLWPTRIGALELKKLKTLLGSEYAVSSQLQQRPSPESGGIIKKAWFQIWKSAEPPKLLHTIQSWDTALTANEMSAYSACCTFGLFKDDYQNTCLILLNMWRGKVEYPELRKMAQRLYNDYRDDGRNPNLKPDGAHIPNLCLVEAKASGITLIQDMIRAGIIVHRFDPTKRGDKIERVRLITHLLEAGKVYLPARPPNYEQLRTFADIFREELSVFPMGSSRDLTDCLTQALLYLNGAGWLQHPADMDRSETSTRVNQPMYG